MKEVSLIREKMFDMQNKSYNSADGERIRNLIDQVNSIINDNFGVVTDAPKKR